MKTPSIKSLSAIFGDNAKQAKAILAAPDWPALRAILGGERTTGIKLWQAKMEALNELVEFHGVETIALGDGSFVDYLNSGDSYGTTIIRRNGNYSVGDWGSLVERHDSMDLQEAIAANGYRQH